ncbi:MAG: glycosyl hydrolase [Gemmatimonadota bacterium]|nr:glycosyl hydrolase [Gemmatimonadota bacterium]MDQ8170653.1 glycosyl hydrolase [Gemmatimonadota bacterium]
MRPSLASWLLAPLFAVVLPLEAQRPASVPARETIDSTALTGMATRMLGPFRGGRSTAVTGIPSAPHSFVMGTTGGGVWRTDDAGQSWRNLSDGTFGGSIGAVEVAPSDPNVIYVGEGSVDIRGNTSMGRGAWRSTDGGRNWTRLGLPAAGQIGRIRAHPADPDRAFAAVLGRPFGRNPERGVYRTTDGGASWRKVLYLNDSTGAVDLVINPRNPRIVYAAMWRAERKPWTLISGSSEGGIWRSTDGGETWAKLGGGLPTGVVGKIGLTVSGANPDRIWAIIEAEPAGGLYRSDDGGTTWTRTNAENKLRQRAWYYTHVRADPQEEHVVYVLNTSLWRSIDGGVSFTEIAVPHGDVHDLWINPTDKRLMAVANDGGAQVSLTRGVSWSTYWNQPTAEFYDVITDRAFPYRVYTAQQDNTTISVPAWSSPNALHPFADYRYASGCETGPVALDPANPRVIYGGCYGGAINRWDTVTDERRNVIAYPELQLGQAAKELRYRFQWVAPILVSRHDPTVVYHGAQVVLRSRDGGMSWDAISPDLTTNTPAHLEASGGPINNDITGVEIFNTIFALAEDRRDPRTLWAGTDDGRVHVTRDGGTTWTEVTPPGMPRFGTVEEIVVSAHAPNRVYVAAQAYRLDDFRPYLWRSDDGGRTWMRLTENAGIPADHPVRSFAEDPKVPTVLYAGTEYGLYVSFDGGRGWQRFPQRLPITPIADLEARDDDLVLSTQGRSLWIIDDLSALRELSGAVTASAAHLVTPAPAVRAQKGVDPFDPQPGLPDQPANGAVLHYWLGQGATGPVTLEIRDALRRTVRLLTSDSVASKQGRTMRLPVTRGLHRIIWDLTYPGPRTVEGQVTWGYMGGVKAPPGTYEAILTANGVTMRRTLTVLPDPRLPQITATEYTEQFRIASAVRDSLDALHRTLIELREVRAQMEGLQAAARRIDAEGELRPSIDALATKLQGLETRFTQTKSRSGQDPIRFAGQLDNQWAELYGIVTGPNGYISGGAEGRPTAGAAARLVELSARWERLRLTWQEVVTKDLPALNATAQRLTLGAIAIPQGAVVP